MPTAYLCVEPNIALCRVASRSSTDLHVIFHCSLCKVLLPNILQRHHQTPLISAGDASATTPAHREGSLLRTPTVLISRTTQFSAKGFSNCLNHPNLPPSASCFLRSNSCAKCSSCSTLESRWQNIRHHVDVYYILSQSGQWKGLTIIFETTCIWLFPVLRSLTWLSSFMPFPSPCEVFPNATAKPPL